MPLCTCSDTTFEALSINMQQRRRNVRGKRRGGGPSSSICRNGPKCYYLAAGACNFYHPEHPKGICDSMLQIGLSEEEENMRWSSIDEVEFWCREHRSRVSYVTQEVLSDMSSEPNRFSVMERAEGLDRFLYIDLKGYLFLIDPEARTVGRQFRIRNYVSFDKGKGVIIAGELIGLPDYRMQLFLATDIVRDRLRSEYSDYSGRAERLREVLAAVAMRGRPSLFLTQKRVLPLAALKPELCLSFPYPTDGFLLVRGEGEDHTQWHW